MSQIRKPVEGILANDFLEKMDLRSLLQPLWANKWIIFSTICLSLILGYGQVRKQIPQFSSNVLLQLEERSNLVTLDKDFSPASLLSSKSSSAIGLYTALIKSRYILEPVIQRLGLDVIALPQDQVDADNADLENANEQNSSAQRIHILQFITPELAEREKFFLTVTGKNQYELRDNVNRIILKGETGKIVTSSDAKGEFRLLVGSLQATKGTKFVIAKKPIQPLVNKLTKQLVIHDLSTDLQLASTVGILKISMEGPNPTHLINVLNTIAEVVLEKSAEKKSKEATKTLEFIVQQLPSVKQSLDQAETVLSDYLAKHGMIDLNSESRILLNNMTQTRKNLTILRMNRAAALKKYTELHPNIILMKEKEKALETELHVLQKDLSQLPSRDQKILSLMRDVRVKSQLYMILLNKIQSLQITRGGTISDVSILGYATLPDAPLPNATKSIMLFSLLFGFVFGAVLIYLQNLLNRKICDPAIIENQFNLPNVAIIPFTEKQHKLFKINNPKNKLVPLLAHLDPKDLSIEALRSFRTSVQFTMLESKNNIITISGVSPGVGKSFVSGNFAFLQAQTGKKVLLIDGDIRKGHLKDYFKIGQPLGLSEVVCGTCAFEEAVIKGPIENLDFLATGLYPPNPSELLMSNRFKELLEQTSKLYELIIIDTAPILAVTDAAVIARHAGANFLVLASNMHVTKEIELAIRRLDTNGITVNGTIFNYSKKQSGLYRNSNVINYQYQYEYK